MSYHTMPFAGRQGAEKTRKWAHPGKPARLRRDVRVAAPLRLAYTVRDPELLLSLGDASYDPQA